MGVCMPSIFGEQDNNDHEFVELLHRNCTVNINPVDMRPIQTHECACGSSWFRILAWFDDNEVAGYLTDMECAYCGTLYRAPYPADAETADAEWDQTTDG